MSHHHVVVGRQHRLLTEFGDVIEIPNEDDVFTLDGADVVSVASEILSAQEYRKKHQIASSTSTLPDPFQTFDDAPFDDRLKAVCKGAGFAAPSPIQAQARAVRAQPQP